MPSPFDKPDKPEKPAKPAKPDVHKDKPFSISPVPMEFLPPPYKHPNRLISVTDKSGDALFLAFSTGRDWITIPFGDVLPAASDPDPDEPEIPVVAPAEI